MICNHAAGINYIEVVRFNCVCTELCMGRTVLLHVVRMQAEK